MNNRHIAVLFGFTKMGGLIRLYDSIGQDLIDSVSGDYEDSFTLETFDDMCNEYANLGKSFIIARVQTIDSKQPEKVFRIDYRAIIHIMMRIN